MSINESIKIGKCIISGRIVMPPMATGKSENGYVTQELCDYYARRSANPNISLIITEHSYVDRSGIASKGQLSMAENGCIEGFVRLVNAVHISGRTKIFAQISHAGGNADIRLNGGTLLAPSAGIYRSGTAVDMSINDICRITERFAEAAMRTAEAGFDGVEIHSAHGYLLNQFYSPLCNRREDEYGCQNLENRLRFHTEIIKRIKQAVGNDFPVSVRLGGCDYMKGGSTIQDCAAASQILEKAGADLISVSGGINGFVRKDCNAPGYFRDMSSVLKNHVKIPVLLTGGVTGYSEADSLLKEGAADMIGIGRALLKNAYL